MRIITGSRRGRKLKTLPGDAVRPTPDRVKEALFNILQFDLEGRVFLDLFAGSGQIGLEALSRGAKRAVFVDSAKASCGVVLENIHTTGFENEAQVMNAEYASYLLRCTETFGIAFLVSHGHAHKGAPCGHAAHEPRRHRDLRAPHGRRAAGDGGGIRARARLPLRKNLVDRVSPSKHGVSAKRAVYQ